MEWLNAEMTQRGWSQRQIARRAGVSQAAISRVLSGDNRPGLEVCEGIAKALDLPLTTVLIEAGLIQGLADLPPEFLGWAGRLKALSDHQRELTISAMEHILRVSEGRDPRS